uniref:nascent polypeptide-associated complex subunit alpha, muscle-specific form-like n=1 Tax=Myxine glutinosa TaxID=7769 RepID=UPI00358DF107
MVKFVQSVIFLAFLGNFFSICTSTPIGPERLVMQLSKEEEPDAGMIQSVQVFSRDKVKDDKVLAERAKMMEGWWKKLAKALKKLRRTKLTLQRTVDVKQEMNEMNINPSEPRSKTPCPQPVSPILIFNLPSLNPKPPQFQPKPLFPKHINLPFPSSTTSSATPKPSPTINLPSIHPKLPTPTAQGYSSSKTQKSMYIRPKPFSFKPKQVVLKYQPTMKRPEPSSYWPGLALKPKAPGIKKPKFIYIRPKIVAPIGKVKPTGVVKKPDNVPYKPSLSWLKPPVTSIPQRHPGKGEIYKPSLSWLKPPVTSIPQPRPGKGEIYQPSLSWLKPPVTSILQPRPGKGEIYQPSLSWLKPPVTGIPQPRPGKGEIYQPSLSWLKPPVTSIPQPRPGKGEIYQPSLSWLKPPVTSIPQPRPGKGEIYQPSLSWLKPPVTSIPQPRPGKGEIYQPSLSWLKPPVTSIPQPRPGKGEIYQASLSWLKPPVTSIPQPRPGKGEIYVPQSETNTPRPWISTEEIRVRSPPTTTEEPIARSSNSGLDKTTQTNVMDRIETVVRDTLEAFGSEYHSIQIANTVILRPRNIQKTLLIQLAPGRCRILMEKEHKVLLDCIKNNKRTLVWIGSGTP